MVLSAVTNVATATTLLECGGQRDLLQPLKVFRGQWLLRVRKTKRKNALRSVSLINPPCINRR